MRERMSIKAIRICVKDSVKMRFECVECKIGRNGRWGIKGGDKWGDKWWKLFNEM